MEDVPTGEWLRALAARTPTPGGGAVAGLAAASAAALIGMVAAYTQGGRFADRQDSMRSLETEAAGWRVLALQLAAEDEAAFGAVAAAYAMPRRSEVEKAARTEAVQRALAGAAGPPLRTSELAQRIITAAAELVSTANPNLLADVGTASAMAEAALSAAMFNIAANAALLTDADERDHLRGALEGAAAGIDRARTVTRQVLEAVGA